MEQNTKHNFKMLSSRTLDELEAALHVMEHEKSGARLVWLERKEENKTFGIAFQTQPWDDTGVFHILEHSVLCGSERYPIKDPFVELLKSSLNTFLNAMTFPDKTLYPFSTRNHQDYVNLLRVYMDAVLHPMIHQKPEIFGQEGWHYELSESGEPSYKGVVFNEMKGAFASPDSLMEYELNRRLFPDTCYRFESGGHPEHIPELTYEAFVQAHKRLYHPSNSYIFLDGNVEIDRVLGILDEEFLSAFDRAPVPGDVLQQAPVDGGTAELTYELSPQEELAGRARLAEGFVACTYADREKLTALRALADVLCGDNQAPLKRRLLESGLARDVSIGVYDSVRQPWVWLEARDVGEDKFDQAADALRQEMERLAREGLDHKRISATLDNMEFQARQRDFGRMPQGLVFGMQVLDSWLYGGDPAANLIVGGLYDGLRQKMKEGYFEELIRQVFLQNPHRCRVHMRPSHTLGRERQEREDARLNAARSQWSQEDAAQLRKEQAGIEAWQAAPDAPEDLATVPMLKLSEIPQEPEELPTCVEEAAGLKVLRHTLPTGGITYFNLYFSLDGMNPAQLTRAAFLARLLGTLETDSHSQEELQREMRSVFGAVSFTIEPYSRRGVLDRCKVFLCASCSVLDTKIEQALELLTELITESHWDDSKRVYEYLCQHRAALTEEMAMSGHSAGFGRASAGWSAECAALEYAGGIEYLRWLKDLEENFQERFPALAKELAALAEEVFCQARLTLSVTGSKPDAEERAGKLLAGKLSAGAPAGAEWADIHPWGPRREGIVIPADVSFAALSGAFPAAAKGGAKVMRRVAELSYLWNAVRVQGGAYGVGMVLRDSGLGGFYSYRDPSAERTLGCYGETANFLRGMDEEDLTGMIIGAVADSDPLLTPRLKGKTADARYWRGTTQEDLRRMRREILAATVEELNGLAGEVEKLAESGSVCVLGSQRQIDACGSKLGSVTAL